VITELSKLDARIPKWDTTDLIPRNCPICRHSGDSRYVRPDGLFVKYCDTCGTWFVSPAPSDRQLKDFYSRYDKTHRREPAVAGRELAERYRGIDPQSGIVMQEITSMKQLTGRLCLDVGFGRGYSLACFKLLGAHATGLELDPDAIACAKQWLGIDDVRNAEIMDLNDDAKYDVITMLDFIEHPLNPFEVIEKAHRLLSPSGLLVIHTPNSSFVSEEPQPPIFRVDLEHMQYFTFRTCSFVASVTGFEIVHLESFGFPYLAGIDRLPAEDGARLAGAARDSIGLELVNSLKHLVLAVPGMKAANQIRKTLGRLQEEQTLSERLGRYHLLCIFRKPE